MRRASSLPPIERIRGRLIEEVVGHEQTLAGIGRRLTFLVDGDPHRRAVLDIRAAVERDMAQAKEEIAALDAVIELAAT